jgi:serine/threonine protein kinase
MLKIKEEEIITILKQLSNALFCLQKKSIAHRDIKPENILIFKNAENETVYKICDFGEAKDYAYIRAKKQKTLRGTELYMSPILFEGLKNKIFDLKYNPYKSDVFSLGMCLLFAGTLRIRVLCKIRECKNDKEIERLIRVLLGKKYGENFISLIKGMLKIKEEEIISILKQLSNALYFLQKKSIAHRDVKPENILLFKNTDKNNINNTIYKICDFGEAKDYAYIRSKKQKTLRGTELYMSPLLYNGLIHEDSYVEHDAYKSDVFSLGCCIIIAMNLNFDIILEIRKIKEQEEIREFLKKKLNGKYSEKLLDIVMKMINFNEKDRIDFIQLENLIEKNF